MFLWFSMRLSCESVKHSLMQTHAPVTGYIQCIYSTVAKDIEGVNDEALEVRLPVFMLVELIILVLVLCLSLNCFELLMFPSREGFNSGLKETVFFQICLFPLC